VLNWNDKIFKKQFGGLAGRCLEMPYVSYCHPLAEISEKHNVQIKNILKKIINMKPKNLTELSDQELLQKMKKIKTNKIIDATIIGFTFGIAIYSSVKNGFGFSTFFPLIIAFIIVRNSTNNKILEKEIQKELKSRNL